MSGNKKPFHILVLIIAVSLAAWVVVHLFFTADKNKPAPDVPSAIQDSRSMPRSTSGVEPSSDIYLYFANADNSFLTAEKRYLRPPDNAADFGKLIIQELIEGSRNKLVRTVPEKTVLNAFYISDDGIAFVDFSHEIKEHHPGGSHSEHLTIYSIVNSIVYNIPDINAVKILINGNEASTLAGHIGLDYPIRADMVMVR